MNPTKLSRPASSEYKPSYDAYIGPVADQDALDLLARQKTALDGLRTLDESRALHRYAPGKWSVKEVIGHVADAERIFSYRMLRIARGDKTPLANFDQEPYIEAAGFDRFPVGQLVDAYHATRNSTLSIANEIDADGWSRMGVAGDAPVSARAIAYVIAGHAAHHFGILRDKYRLTL
ncbi:MAG: DinB family protein [Gemmatimonadaceae bacterium]